MAEARSVIDVILGEAKAGNFDDMLAIASVINNRSGALGVSPEQVVSDQREFNAYGIPIPQGNDAYRDMAQRALSQVQQQGSIHAGMFYSTPATTQNLPSGLSRLHETDGHVFFEDPQRRSIRTAEGFRPVSQDWSFGGTQVAANVPTPTARPTGNPLLSAAGSAYLARNPDVANSMFADNPLAHYSQYGQTEGRIWDGTSTQAPDANADYLTRNADVAGSKFSGNPYEHYVNHGQFEGRQWNGAHPPIPTARPEPVVASADPAAAYLARNKDVAANGMNAADHYLTYGINEGRSWDGPTPIPTSRPTQSQLPNYGVNNYGNTREIYQPQAGLFGEPASPYLDGGYNGFSASQGGGGFTPIPTPRPVIGGYSGLGNIPTPTSANRVSGYTPPHLSTVPIPTTAPRIAGYVGLQNVPIPTGRPTLGGSGLPAGYSGNIPTPTPRPTW